MKSAVSLVSLLVLAAAAAPASADSWQWLNPLPAGSDINAIWGSAPEDVFAVGDGGLILHFDGNTWEAQPSGTRNTLLDVWGTGPNDVFAVGLNGTILHHDGADWSAQDSPTRHFLNGIYGVSPDEVYAVGTGRLGHLGMDGWAGVILYYDGLAWSEIAADPERHFTHAWGFDDQFFVAGFDPASALGLGGLIYHHDGMEWTEYLFGTTPYEFTDLFGYGSDVLALGAFGIWFFDGSGWIPDSTPSYMNSSGWGSGPEDIYLAGYLGLDRWNGTEWAHLAEAGEGLRAVFGTGPADVYAGGEAGRLFHWDGLQWGQVGGGLRPDLTGVWAFSATDAVAVGRDHWYSSWRGLLAWNGTGVEAVAAPEEFEPAAVWGASPTEIYVAGTSTATGTYATIYLWDRSQWTEVLSNIPGEFRGIWGTSADDIYAVGHAAPYRHLVMHWDGEQWSELATGGTAPAGRVWGTAADDVYVLNGIYLPELLHWNGQEWNDVAHPADYVSGIWGPDSGLLFAVADPPVRWDGAEWAEMDDYLIGAPEAIGGTAADDVYAVGGNGYMARYDGLSWTEASCGAGYNLNAICGNAATGLFVVGDRGAFLHLPPAGPAATPTPTPTTPPPPTVTPTAGPDPVLRVTLELPATAHPGQPFWVTGRIENTYAPFSRLPVVFFLDVYGEYWFWPSWIHYDPPSQPNVDYQIMDIPYGTIDVSVISSFTWPNTGNQTVPGLRFWGAILNASFTAVLGEHAMVEWGYGP